jgi:hypothetical protein
MKENSRLIETDNCGMQKNVSAAAIRIGRTKPVYINYTRDGRYKKEGAENL